MRFASQSAPRVRLSYSSLSAQSRAPSEKANTKERAATSSETIRVATPDKNLKSKMLTPGTAAHQCRASETNPGKNESPWPATTAPKALPSADSSDLPSGDT